MVNMVDSYCLQNIDRILAGGNPVKDLIDAGLILDKSASEGGLKGVACSDIHGLKMRLDEPDILK